jgi:hypothetical protein
MRTQVKVSNTGRVDGHTWTWTNRELNGYHGGVVVFIEDASENVLYNTPLRRYRVDGKWVPALAMTQLDAPRAGLR